jgi:hypothetical protein
MYLIDKNNNQIKEVIEKKFSDLGFREREHLQEWIAKLPSCLGEDLLIIQKEFDGFDDTSERLDLLALDKDGNLVIIENKLDDSGKNVIWQALKYASYCSSLTINNIIEIYQKYLGTEGIAQDKLVEFFEVQDLDEIELNKPQSQRIFFVAANFRKEVTSTALYLSDYNLKIKCFKVTPYQKDNDLYLDIDQIIPMKDSEDYIIRMAEKNQETILSREKVRERVKINLVFWEKFIEEANKKTDIYQNISPSKDSWLWKSAGIGGLGYSCVVSKTFARAELYINTPNQDSNKKIFDLLYNNKVQIESEIGLNLEWERMDGKRASRIKYEKEGFNINNEEDWDDMNDFLIQNITKLEKYFSKRISEMKRLIK